MDIIYKMKATMLRRGYSPRSIVSYVYNFKRFLVWVQKDLRKIGRVDVEAYLDYLAIRKMAGSSLNLNLAAIKFGLGLINKRITLGMKYSRKPKHLPTVLTKQEIGMLLRSIINKKHWLIIALMYSAGLRVGETVTLRMRDLEIDRGIGWVRHGKGAKDRMFIIADRLKARLSYFCRSKEGWQYVFKGYLGHYSVSSVQFLLKKAAREAEIAKNVHPHTLRHSFATHLIEAGYPVSQVQMLLGHAKSETTMIYVHTATNDIDVKSPFDTLP